MSETEYACSAFAAKSPGGKRLLGRSWDFHDTPAMLLYTSPPDGYNRYQTIQERLTHFQGIVSPDQAMDILAEVKLTRAKGMSHTLWSVVYNQDSGEMRVPLGMVIRIFTSLTYQSRNRKGTIDRQLLWWLPIHIRERHPQVLSGCGSQQFTKC